MKNAIIDIGSNSIKMRIYRDVDLYNAAYYMNVTRLAKNLLSTGKLCDSSIEDSYNTIIKFVGIARSEEAENVMIYATQALREASNAAKLIDRVFDATGIMIDIIDGPTEAEIGFLGAKEEVDGAITLIDIGGASTEIVSGDTQIRSKKSYPIGAVKLKEEELDLKEIFNDVIIENELVGIGGTITTILAIRDSISNYTRSSVQGKILSYKDISNVQQKLLAMSVEERKSVVGLHPNRADIICYGIEILLFIMKDKCIDRIIVSDFGSMEGYMKRKGLL